MPSSKYMTGEISTLSDRHHLLMAIFQKSLRHFGSLHWWPGEGPFEIAIGAILTQNTAWTNVEKAISNLKDNGLMSPEGILSCEQERLAKAIRPSGYFNIKAKKLKTFAEFLLINGGMEGLSRYSTGKLRDKLLSVNGIGPETADDILLYCFERPVFVVDAYTRRILLRHGIIEEDAKYDQIQSLFHQNIPPRAGIYNEYHAQIVYIGKTYCKRSRPGCKDCPISSLFPVNP